jgi:hypothetical protein
LGVFLGGTFVTFFERLYVASTLFFVLVLDVSSSSIAVEAEKICRDLRSLAFSHARPRQSQNKSGADIPALTRSRALSKTIKERK